MTRLNEKQFEKLSDITSDLALVSIASVVLPAVFNIYDLTKVILGTLIAIVFWFISLLLRR